MIREPHHGGLQLEGILNDIGESEENQIHADWDITQKVTDYLHLTLGCPMPTEPNFDFPMLKPNTLSTASSEQYLDLYTRRTGWLSFFREKLAEHKSILLAIEAEMDDISRRIRTSARKYKQRQTTKGTTKPPSTAEMADDIGNDPRYKELQQQRIYHKAVIVRLEAKLEGADGEQALQSRAVEIRRQDFDQNNRNSSIRGPQGVPVTGGRGMRRPR